MIVNSPYCLSYLISGCFPICKIPIVSLYCVSKFIDPLWSAQMLSWNPAFDAGLALSSLIEAGCHAL